MRRIASLADSRLRGKAQHELFKFLSPQQSEIPVLDLGP